MTIPTFIDESAYNKTLLSTNFAKNKLYQIFFEFFMFTFLLGLFSPVFYQDYWGFLNTTGLNFVADVLGIACVIGFLLNYTLELLSHILKPFMYRIKSETQINALMGKLETLFEENMWPSSSFDMKAEVVDRSSVKDILTIFKQELIKIW